MEESRSIFDKYRNKVSLPLDPEYLATLSAQVISSDRNVSMVDFEVFAAICAELTCYREKNNVDSITWKEYKNLFIDNIPSYAKELNTDNPEEMYFLERHRMRACQLYVAHNFEGKVKELNNAMDEKLNNNNGGNA